MKKNGGKNFRSVVNHAHSPYINADRIWGNFNYSEGGTGFTFTFLYNMFFKSPVEYCLLQDLAFTIAVLLLILFVVSATPPRLGFLFPETYCLQQDLLTFCWDFKIWCLCNSHTFSMYQVLKVLCHKNIPSPALITSSMHSFSHVWLARSWFNSISLRGYWYKF